MGSFLYVFFFMASTDSDEKKLFSSDKVINCFILAASYVGARSIFYGQVATITSYGAVLNPATALGICMSNLFNDGFKAWKAIYLYPTVPFAGSFLAVLFFELVYKKTQAFLSGDHGGDDNSSNGSSGVHEDNIIAGGEHD